MKNGMIAILLSTYNGEKYLKEQIDSIINQDYKNWELYIRDDGSTDSTLSIIQYYSSIHSNIYLLEDTDNLGAAMSFMTLLSNVDSEYYMFCDQDDVWMEDKVTKSICKMIELESTEKKPILVFSDAKVTDAKLNIINPSFWDYNKAYPQILLSNSKFINVFNCSPGCTMIFNNELKKHLNDFDSNILMHDWYLMIKATMHGVVGYINDSLMFYRQHSNNFIGADEITTSTLLEKILSLPKTCREQLKTFKFVTKYTHVNFLEYYILKLKFNYMRLKKVSS